MKKLQKNLILCLLLALSLMLTTTLAQGSSPEDLSGSWTGSDMGGGMEAVLNVKGREEGTLHLTIGGKTDTGELTFDKEGLSFSASFTQENQIGVKSCSGVMMPMEDALTLSLTMQFNDGSMMMPLIICKRTGEAQGDQDKPGATEAFAVPQWGIDLKVPPSLTEAMVEDPPADMNPFSFRKDALPEDTLFRVAGWLESQRGMCNAIILGAYRTPPEARAGEEADIEEATRVFKVLSHADEAGIFATEKGELVSVGDLAATAFPVEFRQEEDAVMQGWVFLLPFGENTMAVISGTPTPEQTDSKQMILDVLATLRVE